MQAFSKLGQREWAIIAIVASILIAVLWYNFGIKPIQEAMPPVQAEIDRLTIEKQRGEAAEAALPQLRKELQASKLELQEFYRQLPKTEQLSRVLSSLSQQARTSGLTLSKLDRSTASSGVDSVRAIDLKLSMSSSFPSLFVYLKSLERLKRFSTLSGVDLKLSTDVAKNPFISSNLTMTVFTYSPPAATPTDGTTPTTGATGTTTPTTGATP